MATKKKASSKNKAAKRPAARPARKRAGSKRKAGKARTSAASAPSRKRARRVRAVVAEKARQGLNAAREGVAHLKHSTASLVEAIKERISTADGSDDGPGPARTR